MTKPKNLDEIKEKEDISAKHVKLWQLGPLFKKKKILPQLYFFHIERNKIRKVVRYGR